MSVIVLGMEMPECCADCFAISESLDWCKATDNEIFYPKDRLPSFCPLRPLPEKHGRLIDADALEATEDDRYSLGEIGRRERDDIVNALRYNAPTIVEAEGE